MCNNNETIVLVFDPTLQGIMTALHVVYPVREEVADDDELLKLISVLR